MPGLIRHPFRNDRASTTATESIAGISPARTDCVSMRQRRFPSRGRLDRSRQRPMPPHAPVTVSTVPSAPVTLTRAPAGASGPRTCQTAVVDLHAPAAPPRSARQRTNVRPSSRLGPEIEMRIGGIAVAPADEAAGRPAPRRPTAPRSPTTCICQGQSIKSALMPIRDRRDPEPQEIKAGKQHLDAEEDQAEHPPRPAAERSRSDSRSL